MDLKTFAPKYNNCAEYKKQSEKKVRKTVKNLTTHRII